MINIVYALINKTNGKRYIGQTWQTLAKRWRSGHGYKECILIQRAITKYGKDNFYYQVLTFCGTQETADYWEKYFIDHFKSNNKKFGYNLREGGNNSKLSLEQRAKISKTNKGRKHTSEEKAKMSASKVGKKRPPFTQETRRKISEAVSKRLTGATWKIVNGKRVWSKKDKS